ncbi:MAG: SDR family NAD(P)-dependent oxidoreductase [Cyclobacteriaceae bacterium]
MTRISILGCGWLGLPLGAALSENGFHVMGSTTRSEKLNLIKQNGISPFLISLDKMTSESAPFFETEILIVTIPPGNASNPENYFDQLKAILSFCEKGSVKHTIFVSSTSVYPSENKEVREKDASESALTRSGVSLLNAEKLFDSADNTTIRLSGLVGDNRNPGRWFAGKKNLKGGNIPVNMIHLEDCIGVIEMIIRADHWGQVFNACAPDHPLKKDYYPKLASDLGLEPPRFEEIDASPWKRVSSEYLIEKTCYQFKRSIWEI